MAVLSEAPHKLYLTAVYDIGSQQVNKKGSTWENATLSVPLAQESGWLGTLSS